MATYWYTYLGSDCIDPTAVGYSTTAPKGGNSITIKITPRSNTYGGTITYQVEVSTDGTNYTLLSTTTATSVSYTIPKGSASFRARVQARDNMGFTSSDWVYGSLLSVTNNSAPGAPGSITVPVSPKGGGTTTITWTAASDVDGNLSGYELSRQLNGGSWVVLYTGSGRSYADVVPKGSSTVAYRVRAYDADGEYGTYTTSATRTVVNNNPPVITSSLSGDLGVKDAGFVVPYTVTDAEGGTVTVVEQVGSDVKRTYAVTLGAENQFQVTGEYFMCILNGAQTIKITATDEGGMSAVLTLTFTKAVYAASISLANPLAVESAITVAIMSVLGSIPADAAYSLKATNNGADSSPVWQDVKADVLNGRNIVFSNSVQANGPAFNFLLEVERASGGSGGYIQSLQGGFQ